MGQRAQAARNFVLSQAPKRELVPTPFWPDLNGFVHLEDVPSDEVTQVNNGAIGSNGQFDPMKAGAGLICKALVVREDDGTFSPITISNIHR